MSSLKYNLEVDKLNLIPNCAVRNFDLGYVCVIVLKI